MLCSCWCWYVMCDERVNGTYNVEFVFLVAVQLWKQDGFSIVLCVSELHKRLLRSEWLSSDTVLDSE